MAPSNALQTTAVLLAALLALTALPTTSATLLGDVPELLPDDGTPAFPDAPSPVLLASTDTSAPVIDAIASPSHPEPDEWYNNDDLHVEVSATDAGTGVSGYSYRLGSGPLTPDCTIDRTSDSFVVYNVATHGTRVLSVRAIDGAGNCGEPATLTFRVDTIDPKTTFKDPKPDETIDTTFASVTVLYDDTDDGRDQLEQGTQIVNSSIRFLVDGVDRTHSPYTHFTTSQLHYRPPFGWTIGEHTLQLTFRDSSVGADLVTETWTFRASPAHTVDGDGDTVPDAAEPTACAHENRFTDMDGTCTDGDYRPPADALEFLGNGLGEMTRFLEKTGTQSKGDFDLHLFN